MGLDNEKREAGWCEEACGKALRWKNKQHLYPVDQVLCELTLERRVLIRKILGCVAREM